MALLEINNLKTYYDTEEGDVHAADGIDLSVDKNEFLGIVGESGSGKTTVARSINRIMDDNAEIVEGSVVFDGVDLTELTRKELEEYRWNDISMIPQSSMNALDPVYTLEEQFVEIILAHEDDTTKEEAKERSRELFELVDLEPSRVTDYPHQFSGGMKQRAMIALSLALEPRLVIADEPTTALDVIVQKQILDRIKDIREETEMAMLLITHDISVVSEMCDKIAVFYGGKLVEYADKRSVIRDPHHPYTMGLRNAFPTISVESQSLISIPGRPPDLHEPEDMCLFADRCPFAQQDCYEQAPELAPVDDEGEHYAHCHRADEAEALRPQAAERTTWYDHTNVTEQ